MIYFCLLGLLGSLLMLLGDQLLYLSKSSAKKEKTTDAMDYVAEVMSKLPVKRFCAGGLIGPFAVFVYCVGFYHLVLAVNPDLVVWKNVALAAFLLNCFGIIYGGAFHSHFPYLGLFRKSEQKETRDIIVKYFSKLMIFTYIGEGIGFVLMLIMIASGATIFPRWCAIITPGVLMLLKPLVAKIPGMVGKFISGGWTNLISVIYYIVIIVVQVI